MRGPVQAMYVDQRRAPFCELAGHVLLTLRLGDYKLHDPLTSAARVPHFYVSFCQFGLYIIAGLCRVSPACLVTTLPNPPVPHATRKHQCCLQVEWNRTPGTAKMRIEALLNEAPGCSDTTANSSHKSARMDLPPSTLSGSPPKTSTNSPSQVPQERPQVPETKAKGQLGKLSSGQGDHGKRKRRLHFLPNEIFLLALCEQHRDENHQPIWPIITWKYHSRYGCVLPEEELKAWYREVIERIRALSRLRT